MAQRLKRWESPRKSGRNDKGKGGSARQRQRKKQFKLLQKQLKQSPNGRHPSSDGNQNTQNGRDSVLSRFLLSPQSAQRCNEQTSAWKNRLGASIQSLHLVFLWKQSAPQKHQISLAEVQVQDLSP